MTQPQNKQTFLYLLELDATPPTYTRLMANTPIADPTRALNTDPVELLLKPVSEIQHLPGVPTKHNSKLPAQPGPYAYGIQLPSRPAPGTLELVARDYFTGEARMDPDGLTVWVASLILAESSALPVIVMAAYDAETWEQRARRTWDAET